MFGTQQECRWNVAVSMTLFQLGHRTETTSSQTDCIEIGSRFLLFLGGGCPLMGKEFNNIVRHCVFFFFRRCIHVPEGYIAVKIVKTIKFVITKLSAVSIITFARIHVFVSPHCLHRQGPPGIPQGLGPFWMWWCCSESCSKLESHISSKWTWKEKGNTAEINEMQIRITTRQGQERVHGQLRTETQTTWQPDTH